MADPHALPLAVSTFQACQFIGRPECGVSTVLKYKFYYLLGYFMCQRFQVLSERDYTLILKGELACKRQTSGKVDTVSPISKADIT